MEIINARPYEPRDLIAFFDTESTDVPLWKERSGDYRQPHVVDGAVLLYTHEGVLVDQFQGYSIPSGWKSSEEAFASHGLTEAFLAENGRPEQEVIDAMAAMLQRAGKRVAHNRTFDDRMLRIGLARFHGEGKANEFKAIEQETDDTASLARPICMLPPTDKMKATNFKNSFKTPTLAEAFAHLTGGKQLTDAHSAFADAQHCARVYFLIKGVRMPEFPDDAEAMREGRGLPHGKDECDAAQLDLVDAEK